MRLRERSRQIIKASLASALRQAGVLGWVRGRAMRDKAVILLYHRVTDCSDLLDYAPNGISVTPATFEAHVGYLARRYTLIKLSELVRMMCASEPLPPNACVITFDDGWRDNYDTAYPVLKRYNAPATIFLATNFVEGGRWFWEERAKYLLAHFYGCYTSGGAGVRSTLAGFFAGLNIDELPHLAPSLVPAYLTSVVNSIREHGESRRADFMEKMEDGLAIPGTVKPRHFLSWDEVREMSRNGIEFGAHTRSHTSLTQSSTAEAESEIDGSRRVIHTKLKNASDVFAYPYGKTDDSVRRSVIANGFRCACTTEPGRVHSDSDLFGLPRIDIRQAVSPTPAFLECRMLSLLGMY